MALARRISGFIDETTTFICDFNELKKVMVDCHEENKRRSEEASEKSNGGSEKVTFGKAVSFIGMATAVTAATVMTGGLAAVAIVGAGGVVGFTGGLMMADGENDINKGDDMQFDVSLKSRLENTKAYVKIGYIVGKIKIHEESLKPVLEQIGGHFQSLIIILKRVNGSSHHISGLKDLIITLGSAKQLIDDAFKNIDSSSAKTADALENELKIILKLAYQFSQTTYQRASSDENLFKFIHCNIGGSDESLAERLTQIESLFSMFAKNVRAKRLMLSCRNEIRRFYEANPTVEMIDGIVVELNNLKVQYEDIHSQCQDFDRIKLAHEEHQRENAKKDAVIADKESKLADKDAKIKQLEKKLAEMEALKNQ